MSNMDIQELNYENFSAKLEEKNSTYTLYLAGEMEIINPGKNIAPYLKKIHEKICLHHIKEIDLNIVELSFINSSNIKVLLNWLLDVKNLDQENRYRIRLIYNKNFVWQETAFRPFAIFAKGCFTM